MTPYRDQPLSNPPKPRHLGWRTVCFVVCKVFGCTPGVFEATRQGALFAQFGGVS